jgi:hypothetical protein
LKHLLHLVIEALKMTIFGGLYENNFAYSLKMWNFFCRLKARTCDSEGSREQGETKRDKAAESRHSYSFVIYIIHVYVV